jgi:hypothetical protein
MLRIRCISVEREKFNNLLTIIQIILVVVLLKTCLSYIIYYISGVDPHLARELYLSGPCYILKLHHTIIKFIVFTLTYRYNNYYPVKHC